jgi:cell division septum initiation protein DivIVA
LIALYRRAGLSLRGGFPIIEANDERKQIIESAKADAKKLLEKPQDNADTILRGAQQRRERIVTEARAKGAEIEARLAQAHAALNAAR